MPLKILLSAAALALAAGPALSAEQKCRATKAAYLSIRENMSYDEVARIVGCPGHRLRTPVHADGQDRLDLVWPGQKPGSVLHVTMIDGHVRAEAEDGLR